METKQNPTIAGPYGHIVTFYSFKGGVGRSMALANIAVLLARAGKRVLCIDWDLEAPGLQSYFRAIPRSSPSLEPSVSKPDRAGGLLNILAESTREKLATWKDFVCTRTSAIDQVQVDFISSGEDTTDFSNRLADFSWVDFFANRHGGSIVENLRTEWKIHYDFVLVDSRTGLSDSSGVCTIQMPDLLVLVFAANKQNTDWCERIARGIREGRKVLPYDRVFLPIIPLLSRFDPKEEVDRASNAMDRIAECFAPYYAEWLPRSIKARDMLAWSVLPYMPRYSFEEALAVEDEPAIGAQGLTFQYQLLARLILARLQSVRGILAGVGVPGAALPPLLPSASDLREELRRDNSTIPHYRNEIISRAEESPLEAVEAFETLADICSTVSRTKEAEQLLGEAINLSGDPALALSKEIPRLIAKQAKMLVETGQKNQALLNFGSFLTYAIKSYGDKDTRTAEIHAHFAHFLESLGRNDDASEQYALAVKAYEHNLPSSKPYLLDTLKDWRDLLVSEEKYQELLPVAKRALELEQGNSNPALEAWAEDIYATALKHSGRKEEAVGHYREALRLEELAAYPNEDYTLGISRALKNLAGALNEIQCYDEAEFLLLRALINDRGVFGESFTEAAIDGLNLFVYKAGQGNETESTIRKYEKTLGSDKIDSARDYHEKAKVNIAKAQFADAEKELRLALSLFESELGFEHPIVDRVCNDLGSVLFELNRYNEAEQYLQRAMDINEKIMVEQNPNLSETMRKLALVYTNTGRDEQAEEILQRSQAINEKIFGPNHLNVGVDLVLRAQILTRLEKIDHARELSESGFEIIQTYLTNIQASQQSFRNSSTSENLEVILSNQEQKYTLKIKKINKDESTLLKISGERLDAHNVNEFKGYLEQLWKESVKSLTLDISELRFVDSAGIGVFLKCYKQANSNRVRFALVGVQRSVRSSLEILKLDKLFGIYAQVDAAEE